jgi:hypothetical protein
MAVFPNPSSGGALTAELPEGAGGRARALVLRDLAGAIVKRITVGPLAGRYQVDAADVPAGLYALSLEGDAGVMATQRVVIAY